MCVEVVTKRLMKRTLSPTEKEDRSVGMCWDKGRGLKVKVGGSCS